MSVWQRSGAGRHALGGILAAGSSVVVVELAAAMAPRAGSLLGAVADRVIDTSPGWLVAFSIQTLGGATRAVLLTGMVVAVVVTGGVIGVLAAGRFWPWALAGFGLIGATLALAGIADPLVTAGASIGLGALAAGVGIGVAYLLLRLAGAPALARAALADPWPIERTDAGEQDDPTGPARPTRRAFLTVAGGVLAGVAVAGATGRLLLDRAAEDLAGLGVRLPIPRHPRPPPPPDLATRVPGVSPLLTPTEDFYRIDTAFVVPRMHTDDYRLRVTGMVGRPLELTYAEVLDRVDREADVTLACVSNEVGGDLVGTARWLGFALADLLDDAQIDSAADQVVGRAVDGWTAGFPTGAVYDGRDALVVVGMNGEPLPRDHGFPVRLVVAGLYGYVSDTKWLTEIELTTWDAYDAYWVPRGWAKEGPIKTQSRIDVPRRGDRLDAGRVMVAGVAWAGTRGIERVEVSIDDGPFVEARLADPLADAAWRQWVLDWDAEPGKHRLVVRATDGTGAVQPADRTPPRPDGAAGHHTISVTVA